MTPSACLRDLCLLITGSLTDLATEQIISWPLIDVQYMRADRHTSAGTGWIPTACSSSRSSSCSLLRSGAGKTTGSRAARHSSPLLAWRQSSAALATPHTLVIPLPTAEILLRVWHGHTVKNDAIDGKPARHLFGRKCSPAHTLCCRNPSSFKADLCLPLRCLQIPDFLGTTWHLSF